jgi:cell division protein FtsL
MYMGTLVALLVVGFLLKGTYLGKILKMLWKMTVELTKFVYFMLVKVYKVMLQVNKKIHPVEKSVPDNVIDLNKIKSSK